MNVRVMRMQLDTRTTYFIPKPVSHIVVLKNRIILPPPIYVPIYVPFRKKSSPNKGKIDLFVTKLLVLLLETYHSIDFS